jgi:hypothetical protein
VKSAVLSGNNMDTSLAENYGGALYLESGRSIHSLNWVRCSSFQSCCEVKLTTVQDTKFFENGDKTTYGGAIYIKNGEATVEGCTFAHNTAQIGGGVCSIDRISLHY